MKVNSGEVVKISFFATVKTNPGAFGPASLIVEDNGGQYRWVRVSEIESIERPRALYRIGEIYEDKIGDRYRYNGEDWYRIPRTGGPGSSGVFCGDDIPVRPLRLMIVKEDGHVDT